MRAISLWAPYGTLIAEGYKPFETRGRRCNWRGEVAIQQSLHKPPTRGEGSSVGGWNVWRDDQTGEYSIRYYRAPSVYDVRPLPLGKIVAVADLVDCIPMIGPMDNRR